MLQEKVKQIFDFHGLGAPSLDLAERMKQIHRLELQSLNLKNPNLILTFEPGIALEYTEENPPTRDLSVIGVILSPSALSHSCLGIGIASIS